MLTTIGYWGSADHAKSVVTCLEKLGGMPAVSGHSYDGWKQLRYYPALLALYSFGLAAMANGNYSLFWKVIRDAKTLAPLRADPDPLVLVAKMTMMGRDFQDIATAPGRLYEGAYLAQRLSEGELWDELQSYFSDDVTFQQFYPHFEFLYGMAGVDISEQFNPHKEPNVGCMPWLRNGHFRKEETVRIKGAIESEDGWEPIRGGMFEGDTMRALKALEEFDELLSDREYSR